MASVSRREGGGRGGEEKDDIETITMILYMGRFLLKQVN